MIKNFCILAHVDHGKSTLADRFLELTGTVEKYKMREQFLDMNPLEREKGITIKMQPVRMLWRLKNHAQMQNSKIKIENDNVKFKNNPLQADTEILPFDFYILNLIDTPGHVDFSYEVSRALAAVEGAILLVDATQGIQAQTMAHFNLAMESHLAIIPAVNKIDLPSAEKERTLEELYELFGSTDIAVEYISAKEGTGVEKLLQRVIHEIPSPLYGREDVSRALIFDSLFDPYQGVIAYVRMIDGEIKKGDKIYFMATGAECVTLDVGFFVPGRISQKAIARGEIGFIATGIKESGRVRVGDTITKSEIRNPKSETISKFPIPEQARYETGKIHIKPLPGYQEPKSLVYASIFPVNQDEYELLRESLWKLKLNDAALSFEPETADSALGRGFRCGFLGMLHVEIISERMLREYNLRLIFSHPSVAYRMLLKKAGRGFDMGTTQWQEAHSAAKIPDFHEIDSIEEPWAKAEVITPARFLGTITTLVSGKRGVLRDSRTLAGDRIHISFDIPLREIVVDFYDLLKSVSQGFASLSYEFSDYRKGDLVRFDIVVAGERIPSFAEIAPRDSAERILRTRLEKLKNLLPRKQFAIALQGEINGRIVARETIPALKKDVTGYLYGGDRTRKMKLWQKQKKGKKRLKAAGKVDIPTEIFIKMMRG